MCISRACRSFTCVGPHTTLAHAASAASARGRFVVSVAGTSFANKSAFFLATSSFTGLRNRTEAHIADKFTVGQGTTPDFMLAMTMPDQAGHRSVLAALGGLAIAVWRRRPTPRDSGSEGKHDGDRRHRRARSTVTIGSIKAAAAVLALTCGTLVVSRATSADVITLPLSDFVIFSGGNGTGNTGGNQTSIGGHTRVIGNIGSNENLFQQGNPLPRYPAQLDGSAYAGGRLTFGQDLSVGDSLHPRQIVANGTATIGSGVTIWGTVDASSVAAGSSPPPVITGGVTAPSSTKFGLIAMPAATVFTAGGLNQTVPAGQGNPLTLAPGTYGALATSFQNQAVILSSGNFISPRDT